MDVEQYTKRLRESLYLDRACWQERYLADADRKYEQYLKDTVSYIVNLEHKMALVKRGRMFLAPQLQALHVAYQELVDTDEFLSEAVKEYKEKEMVERRRYRDRYKEKVLAMKEYFSGDEVVAVTA